MTWFELTEPAWVYVSIPLAAAAVGYLTKVVMIWMMFNPTEFKGVADPWLGWQGQIPRRAAKMAAISVDTLQRELLDPAELIDLVDVDVLVREISGQLNDTVEDVVETVAMTYQPAVWSRLPASAKLAVQERVKDRAPDIIERLMVEFRDNLEQLFDLKHTVVTSLVGDKARLSDLFRRMGGDVFSFIRRAGLVFGFVIGLVQMLALMATGIDLILPLFGLLIGGLTDYVVLQMVFRPYRPKRYFGFRWQGLFHAKREQVTLDYSAVMARDILTPRTMIDGLLSGPMSDRFFDLVLREVRGAVDDEAGAARPLVLLAVGGRAYQGMKDDVARLVVDTMPEHTDALERYAERNIDIESIIAEKMGQMTDEQYEGTLRPAFKDDEWIVVVLGAVLGFVVGELQLHLLLA